MKITLFSFDTQVQPTYDSDSIDRLRYYFTVLVLVACSGFIMLKQYVGESLQCWAPKQFKGGWEQYAETYCLIENTYYVNMNASNLPGQGSRENNELRYYQWVPFILGGMALALYIPRFIWRLLQSFIGIDISIVTSFLRKNAKSNLVSNCDVEKHRAKMEKKKPKTYIDKKKEGEFWGSKLTICLIITKVLSFLSILITMIFMDYFMGLGPAYGWTVTKDLIAGRQWQESGTFPRVTFCDFQIRELGYVNNWSLQCVLMVNMFNEKLFIALWWWYIVLAVLSIYDIVRFFFRFTAFHQIRFISMILNTIENDDVSSIETTEFNRKVLKNDGINLVHLVYSNATIFEAADFVKPLWNNYKNSKL